MTSRRAGPGPASKAVSASRSPPLVERADASAARRSHRRDGATGSDSSPAASGHSSGVSGGPEIPRFLVPAARRIEIESARAPILTSRQSSVVSAATISVCPSSSGEHRRSRLASPALQRAVSLIRRPLETPRVQLPSVRRARSCRRRRVLETRDSFGVRPQVCRRRDVRSVRSDVPSPAHSPTSAAQHSPASGPPWSPPTSQTEFFGSRSH